jgi:thioredoxin 1
MLDPIVDELAEEYAGKLRVVKLDTDANPDVVVNYGVMGMPTLILFKNGEDVARIVGFKPKSKIMSELIEYI